MMGICLTLTEVSGSVAGDIYELTAKSGWVCVVLKQWILTSSNTFVHKDREGRIQHNLKRRYP